MRPHGKILSEIPFSHCSFGDLYLQCFKFSKCYMLEYYTEVHLHCFILHKRLICHDSSLGKYHKKQTPPWTCAILSVSRGLFMVLAEWRIVTNSALHKKQWRWTSACIDYSVVQNIPYFIFDSTKYEYLVLKRGVKTESWIASIFFAFAWENCIYVCERENKQNMQVIVSLSNPEVKQQQPEEAGTSRYVDHSIQII
jgi:hypothetical protein